MRSPLIPALALLALTACATAPACAADLDSVLEQAMHGTNTPASGALLIRDGQIVDQAVRGVRRNDGVDPVRVDDLWLIGSTSKPMTVALIARLVERGTLSWEAPLGEMLPELAESMRPEYRPVTLVQLLSHLSGLPENIRDLSVVDRFFTDPRPLPEQRRVFVAEALKELPDAAPGTKFAYCNTGFLIAAVIAERATGKSFEALMQQEVFGPLGMTRAGFGPTPVGQPLGHRGGKPVTAVSKSDEGVPLMYAPAGNYHMSLHDWALFCLDQMAGSKGRGKLLKPESYRLMQSAQPGSSIGVDWGLQASIAGRRGPVLVHGGSDGNWLAWVVLFPQSGNGVIVVANATDDMGGDKATHALLAALLPTLSPAVESP